MYYSNSDELKYKKKYLKYKKKYLDLKGGSSTVVDSIILNHVLPKARSDFLDKDKLKIFYMGGHGCDTAETLPVPSGCVYVTIAECGKVAYINENRKKFIEMFSSNNDLLKNPIQNFIELRKIFGPNLHIHYPEAENEYMQTYTNNIYHPVLGWDKKEQQTILKSGLYSIGTDLEEDYQIINGKMTDEQVKYLYKDSIYPSYYQIHDVQKIKDLSFGDFKLEMNRLYKIDQSTLFKYFPGIHYNFACRSPCDANESEVKEKITKHDLRRQYSNKVNEHKEDSLLYYIKHNQTENAIKLINESIDDINKSDINGNTPLNFACENKNIELAQLLIESGALLLKEDHQKCYKAFLHNSKFIEMVVTAYSKQVKLKLVDE